jgi:hypothetical protein
MGTSDYVITSDSKWTIDAPPIAPAIVEAQRKLTLEMAMAWDGCTEAACQIVMALGYTPADCLIENYLYAHHRVLRVLGVRVFEQKARWEGIQYIVSGEWLNILARVADPGDEDRSER